MNTPYFPPSPRFPPSGERAGGKSRGKGQGERAGGKGRGQEEEIPEGAHFPPTEEKGKGTLLHTLNPLTGSNNYKS